MDYPHQEVVGQVSDLNVTDDGSRVELDFGNDEHEFSDYKSWKFAFSQLLKFADLRKNDLKATDDEGNKYVKEDANEMILEELGDQTLVFKVDQDSESVIAVVSTDFVSLPTEEVVDTAQEVITSKGVKDFTIQERETGSRLVDAVEFIFDGEEQNVESVGDVLQGGLRIRNSSFGASSLRVNRFYTILACENGMLSRRTGSEFRKVHMGDAGDLRELLREQLDHHIETLWEETDLIKTVHGIEFPIEEQIEFLDAISTKITKRSANSMAAHIIHESGNNLEEWVEEHEDDYENLNIPTVPPSDDETWNTGEENVWGLINAFTGYTTHSDLSSQSTVRSLERVYNDVMEAEDKEDVKAVAGL